MENTRKEGGVSNLMQMSIEAMEVLWAFMTAVRGTWRLKLKLVHRLYTKVLIFTTINTRGGGVPT